MVTLASDFLCSVELEVAGGIVDFGASPFGASRTGAVTGGRFDGPRLSGIVLPGGGNWSRSGRLGDATVGTFDARAIWRTDDGALIQMSYTGRTLIPEPVRAAFADPEAPTVDPADYYLRIAAVFETAAPAYSWLNAVLAIGIGERIEGGVRHRLHAVA